MSISFKLKEHSQYEKNFRNVFGSDVPFASGFELSNVAHNPEPAPEVNVILVTGTTTSTAQGVCERFVNDFHFYHIDVPSYLQCLAEKPEKEARRALGSLHPISLKRMLQEQPEKPVPSFFLMEILRCKFDEEVDRTGQTRFMISGLDEDAATAMRFAEKVTSFATLTSKLDER